MKRIKLFIAALATIAIAGNAQNQNTPYSMYGYGILSDHATSMQRQMGGIGYAMNSGRQINVMNPASYAAIDSLTFLLDMGGSFNSLWSKEGSTRAQSFGGSIDYLTMQFPLTKHMGGSIGLLPYSSVGYSFGNDIKYGAKSNQGTGGISQFYLGWSGKLGPVSVGVNANYNFGKIINDLFTHPSNGGETKFEHVMDISDWSVDFGAQYTARWSKFNKLVVGATFSPARSLHGNSWATIQETKLEAKPDTIGKLTLKDNYTLPASWGAGISYTWDKNSRVMVEADVTYQQWSKAKYSSMLSSKEVIFQGMNFNDRWRYAAGCEIIPNIRGNYAQRMTYRFGGSYCQDYLNINTGTLQAPNYNGVKEFSLSGGIGLPTAEGKTLINLGVEWKNRFTKPQNLIGENYLTVMLGVNFNEVWFWKRKIN